MLATCGDYVIMVRASHSHNFKANDLRFCTEPHIYIPYNLSWPFLLYRRFGARRIAVFGD